MMATSSLPLHGTRQAFQVGVLANLALVTCLLSGCVGVPPSETETLLYRTYGFRFEDYSDTPPLNNLDAGKKRVREIYPPGSDPDTVRKELEQSGMKCHRIRLEPQPDGSIRAYTSSHLPEYHLTSRPGSYAYSLSVGRQYRVSCTRGRLGGKQSHVGFGVDRSGKVDELGARFEIVVGIYL